MTNLTYTVRVPGNVLLLDIQRVAAANGMQLIRCQDGSYEMKASAEEQRKTNILNGNFDPRPAA